MSRPSDKQRLLNMIHQRLQAFFREQHEAYEEYCQPQQPIQQFQQNNGSEREQFLGLNSDSKRQQFLKQAFTVSLSLKQLQKKLQASSKLSKQRKQIYSSKIAMLQELISQLSNQENDLSVVSDNMLANMSQTQTIVEQLRTSIDALEKESSISCGSKKIRMKPVVQKLLMDLIALKGYWERGMNDGTVQKQRTLRKKKTIQVNLIDDGRLLRDLELIVNETMFEKQADELLVDGKMSAIYSPNKNDHQQIAALKEEKQILKIQCQQEEDIKHAHELLAGLGRTQDVQQALSVYQHFVNDEKRKGPGTDSSPVNTQLCNVLGSIYETGTYLPMNLKKAAYYYQCSANAGDSEGIYRYGKLIEQRVINTKEAAEGNEYGAAIREAIKHYQQAAMIGNLEAIADLGYIYDHGVPTDPARRWAGLQASRETETQIQLQPQTFLIQPKIDVAIKYYMKGKQKEHLRCINNLGALYLREHNKIPEAVRGENIEKGMKYLNYAAQLKYPKAYVSLGRCHENGVGVDKNINTAIQMYAKGSAMKNRECQLQYVRCLLSYDTGNNPDQQLKAMDYMRQILLDKPIPEAQYYMALMQERGIGVQACPQTAFSYASKAAEAGYAPAISKLGDYYYSGFHVEKNINVAKEYYMRAAKKKDTHAILCLGLIKEKENQGLPDHLKYKATPPAEYYVEAARLGNSDAFMLLPKALEPKITIGASAGSPEAKRILESVKKKSEYTVESPRVTEQYNNLLNHYTEGIYVSKGIPKTELSLRQKMPSNQLNSFQQKPLRNDSGLSREEPNSASQHLRTSRSNPKINPSYWRQ